jgi:hypothetical protein
MNQVKPHGLAALTAACVLAVILAGTGCGAAVPRGSPVHSPVSAPDGTSTGAAAGRGIGGCAAMLGAHQPTATSYPKIRAQFAHSPWPALRAAGMSYVDLAVRLQTARADGYQAVWFYQRLSLACARHGWKQPPAHQRPGNTASSRRSQRPANP